MNNTKYTDTRVVDPRYRRKQWITTLTPALIWETEGAKEEAIRLVRQINLGSLFLTPRYIVTGLEGELYRPRNPLFYSFPFSNEPITLIDEEPIWRLDSEELPLLQAIRYLTNKYLDPLGLRPKGTIEIVEKFPTVWSHIKFTDTEIQFHCTFHALDLVEDHGQFDRSYIG